MESYLTTQFGDGAETPRPRRTVRRVVAKHIVAFDGQIFGFRERQAGEKRARCGRRRICWKERILCLKYCRALPGRNVVV